MKKHLEYLQDLFNINGGTFDVDDFYTITFTKYEVSLQGRFDSELVKKYNGLVTFSVEDSGYLCGKALIDGISIRITLT